MRHRAAKRFAYIVAALCLCTIVVPLAVVSAVWEWEGLFALAVILGLICNFTLVAFGLSSLALTHDYGLWGDKLLLDCPESIKASQRVFTSGRIGEHYWARGLFPISWSVEGIAITLESQDVVFIDKKHIRRVVPVSTRWCEIIHSDSQIQSPIVLPTRVINRMRDLLPELKPDPMRS